MKKFQFIYIFFCNLSNYNLEAKQIKQIHVDQSHTINFSIHVQVPEKKILPHPKSTPGIYLLETTDTSGEVFAFVLNLFSGF